MFDNCWHVVYVETHTKTRCVKLYDSHEVHELVHNDMYTKMNMHEIIKHGDILHMD